MSETTKMKRCLVLSSKAHCSSVRIFNFIRAVGRGEMTADNALHQLVEDYRDLRDLGNEIVELSREFVGDQEVGNG